MEAKQAAQAQKSNKWPANIDTEQGMYVINSKLILSFDCYSDQEHRHSKQKNLGQGGALCQLQQNPAAPFMSTKQHKGAQQKVGGLYNLVQFSLPVQNAAQVHMNLEPTQTHHKKNTKKMVLAEQSNHSAPRPKVVFNKLPQPQQATSGS